MLSWVLRKGQDGAAGTRRDVEPDNTTFIEQPDTPAPVFAARAFKSAIFGTPGHPDDPPIDTDNMPQNTADGASRTPQKPHGILLTPGASTSRPKRVSFDHKAKSNDATKGKGTGCSGEKSNMFALQTKNEANKRTKLTETMANSRQPKDAADPTIKPQHAPPTAKAETATKTETATKEEDSEEDWEEDDDHCMHDITLDLNEPHSRSGKYWKSEFQQYHQDAKVEMKRLLEYKQLAKSYAKRKDAEAIDLGGKLREEQDRVVKMEKQITEMAAQIASKRAKGDDRENPQLMQNLAEQTARVVQYRNQVQDLEALVRENQDDDQEEADDAKSRRRRQANSPRSQKTLLETQRELRRARSQIKENGDLKEQVKQLKSELRAAEKQASKLVEENKRLVEQDTRPNRRFSQTDVQQEESHRKDEELRRLREEFETFKSEASQRAQETQQVLEKATSKISDLKKENRTLKASSTDAAVNVKANAPGKPGEPVHTLRRSSDHGSNRLSGEDLPKEVGKGGLDLLALGKKLNDSESHTLRAKFREDEGLKALKSDGNDRPPANDLKSPLKEDAAKDSISIFEDRPDLDQPRWKPFIPRSPRNRGYLSDDLNEKIQKSSAIPTGTTPAAPRHTFNDKPFPNIDLLHDQYRRLGLPESDGMQTRPNIITEVGGPAEASKCNLPPERRAAAIARIERRKAERKRQLESTLNKENVRL